MLNPGLQLTKYPTFPDSDRLTPTNTVTNELKSSPDESTTVSTS